LREVISILIREVENTLFEEKKKKIRKRVYTDGFTIQIEALESQSYFDDSKTIK